MNSKLAALFSSHFGENVAQSSPLQAHGSNRKLYRLQSENHRAIGVENTDDAENRAFLEFSKYFRSCGLPVPEIYSEQLADHIYIEEDLGDDTLFHLLSKCRTESDTFPQQIEILYQKVVAFLPRFQIEAGRNLNYEVCYPRSDFDSQSMMWDLNYFKYYFLKLAQIPFDEQSLEDDFEQFVQFLLQADRTTFLYRDFQSRNVMLRDGEPFFIDYQGGRRGALQYDIASLLFDAKANLPFEARERLLDLYMEELSKYSSLERESFVGHYYGYVFIRIMQAMGAYGFRGFYERKTHFLQSVPYAIHNLEYLLKNVVLPVKLPTLMEILQKLVRSTRLRELGNAALPLTIHVQSFAYKNGVPRDETGHGGGFVLDCRSLPNPGRLEEYKNQTGNDSEVISFFERQKEVHIFLTRVSDLLAPVVENYQQRNFSHLEVAFGCTGGQHRSVFCANEIAAFLREKFKVKVELTHREKNNWP